LDRAGFRIANDQDDVDRPLLSGGAGSGDPIRVLRDRLPWPSSRARPKQDGVGAGAERSGEGSRLPLHAIRAETAVMPLRSRSRRDPADRTDETVSIPAGARKMPRQSASGRKPATLDPGWIPMTKTRQTTEPSLRPGSAERKGSRVAPSERLTARGRQKANRKRGQQSASREKSGTAAGTRWEVLSR